MGFHSPILRGRFLVPMSGIRARWPTSVFWAKSQRRAPHVAHFCCPFGDGNSTNGGQKHFRADSIPFLRLLFIFGSSVGTAQEAMLPTVGVSEPSRDGPGVVDACGHGAGRARRVEGGYLAAAIPHETMRPTAGVVDSRDYSRGVDAIGKNATTRTRSIHNRHLSVGLPHEAIHRLSIVSIERPYDSPVALIADGMVLNTLTRQEEHPSPGGGNKRGIRPVR